MGLKYLVNQGSAGPVGTGGSTTFIDSTTELYWSLTKTDTALTNFTKVNDSGHTTGYLPSDIFNGDVATNDTTRRYCSYEGILNSDAEKILSVYNINGTYNTFANDIALSDINGKRNTATIVNSISNRDTYPAFNACLQYAFYAHGTPGTWYLPAIGELAFIMANYMSINYMLNNINAQYPNDSMESLYLGDKFYWSSTEYNSDLVYSLRTDTGEVSICGKDGQLIVIPWLTL